MSNSMAMGGWQVAVRRWAGAGVGQVVEMEVSAQEWATMDRSQSVESEDGRVWADADAWMAEVANQGAQVVWMSSWRARQLAASMRRWANAHSDWSSQASRAMAEAASWDDRARQVQS